MNSMLRSVLIIVILGFLPASFAMAGGVYPLFGLDDEVLSAGPFPSDLFTKHDYRQNTGLRVNLPEPDAAHPSDREDVKVLNTLDGFNLQPRLSIPFSGPIDVDTVNSESVFLLRLGSTLREYDNDGEKDRHWHHGRRSKDKIIGINQIVWDPMTNTLHVESDALLEQHTRYALIVTSGVRDESGKPVKPSHGFKSFRHDLNFGHTKNHDLKSYRKELSEALDRAEAAGVPPRDIVVASVFTTQSVTAVLEKIREQIRAADPPAPADFFLLGPGEKPTVFPLNDVKDIMFEPKVAPPNFPPVSLFVSTLKQIANGAVEYIAFGKYYSPNYLTSETTTFDTLGKRSGIPDLQEMDNEVVFNLFLPSDILKHPKPQDGWPVAIFGHGSPGNKDYGSGGDAFRIAATLADHGIATIVINAVAHGFGPDTTLTVERQSGEKIIFLAGGRSFDQNNDGIIDATEGASASPPYTIIGSRDSRRQTVVDLMQLVRVIEVGVDVDGDGEPDLSPAHIYYFGFSFGAVVGTPFAAIESHLRAVVLNSGGAWRPETFRVSPGNRVDLGELLASRVPSLLNYPGIDKLNASPDIENPDVCPVIDPCLVPIGMPYFNENMPLRDGIPLTVGLESGTSTTIQSPLINQVEGAMEIQQVFEYREWAQQAADPVAYAPHLRKDLPIIVLFGRGDRTVPNPGATALLRAGDLADRTTFYRNDLAVAAGLSTAKNSHMFVFRVAPPLSQNNANVKAIALAAQEQVAEFFASDGATVIDPDGPCMDDGSGCLFEVPIELLPEDLGFIP